MKDIDQEEDKTLELTNHTSKQATDTLEERTIDWVVSDDKKDDTVTHSFEDEKTVLFVSDTKRKREESPSTSARERKSYRGN